MCRRWNFFCRVEACIPLERHGFRLAVLRQPGPRRSTTKSHPPRRRRTSWLMPTKFIRKGLPPCCPSVEHISRKEISAGRGACAFSWTTASCLNRNSHSSPTSPPLQPGRKLKRSDENEFLVNSKFSSYRATLVPRAATCLPGEATPLGRANRGDIHSRRDRQSSRPHHQ